MGHAYDTGQTQVFVVLAQNWLEFTHRMPILHCRCGWLIDVELHGEDVRGFSGEAPVVDRGSPRSGWLQTGLVVGGYALSCTDVRPRVGIHRQRRMATTCTVGRTSRHGDAAKLSRLTCPDGDWTLALTVLPDASDRGLLIWMWRKHPVCPNGTCCSCKG